MIRNPTARLFVAVTPPREVCEQLCAWARAAVRAGGRKPAEAAPRVLEPELLHVTLCFLGDRPAGEIDAFAEQLSTCEDKAPELSLGAPLWLPRRNPRALAVELHDESGRLAKLQGEIVAAMRNVGDWQPNGYDARTGPSTKAVKLRFHPHVTVARLGRGAAPQQRILPPTPSASFTPRKLVLYRSWLSPRGASYEAVASQALVG